ncbi:MAG: Asp/Glu racemase [Pseudomonadota bacterium]
MKLIENLPFTTNRAIGARARIGCVVLASEYTLEHEFNAVLQRPELEGVALSCARIPNSPDINPASLTAMGPLIEQTAGLILPGDQIDALAYGCTSASTVLGPDHVNSLLRAAKPTAQPTNPVTAMVAAMGALSVKRLAVLTPYRSDVNIHIAQTLEGQGLEIATFGSFNEESDITVSAIDTDSLTNAIGLLLKEAAVEAVFVSCTSLSLFHAVATLEQKFGLPVTSSNHAMIWHCLRLAGVAEPMPDMGKLYSF